MYPLHYRFLAAEYNIEGNTNLEKAEASEIVDAWTDENKPAPKHKIYRTIRPITSSSVNNLGQVLVEEKWQFLDPSLPPTSLVDLLL